jgi:hypothetical protein
MTSIHGTGGLGRALIEMPAWQQTGPLGWAAFSRYADLGSTAMIMDPTVAFGSLLISALALISFYRDGRQPRAATVPLYGTMLMVVGGLLATIKAAPIMLTVRHLDNDAVGLQHALDGFQFWGGVREVFQLLAFIASLGTVAVLLRPTTPQLADQDPAPAAQVSDSTR